MSPFFRSTGAWNPTMKKPAAGDPGRVLGGSVEDQLPDSVFSPDFFQPAMPFE